MAQRKGFNFKDASKIMETTASTAEEEKNSIEETTAPEPERKTMQEKIKEFETPLEYEKAFVFKFVPREKLVFNEDNKFPISDVDKLAMSILQNGLLHNLEVLYNEELDNYLLESGERRTRAIDWLIERYDNYEDKDSSEYKLYMKNVKQYAVEGYPCNIKKSQVKDDTLSEEEQTMADIDSQIRLRVANFEVRDAEENREIFRKELLKLKELYEAKNKLLKKGEKININQEIGAKLGISDRQVKNYAATTKLIPELQELLDKNNITLTEGVNYSKLTEEEQKQLLYIIEQGRPREEVNALYKEIDRLNKEIKNSEKELDKANEEKESTQRKLDQARSEVEEIRKELDSSNNSEKIESLKAQLQTAKANLKEQEQKWNDTTAKQEQTINELNAKLLEKKEIPAEPVDTEVLRLSFKMDDNLQRLEECIRELLTDCEAYKKIYRGNGTSKKPEEYEKEIYSIVKTIKM